ncbi:MAG: hypothetical protein C0487_09580 [Leptothrix sp. (in: Bacteria)]|nr:hypothetical protein [Leptothrix sp. (in: b-proteobacteria)]
MKQQQFVKAGMAVVMAMLMGASLAAEPTEQEQAVLVQLREVFAKQMGRQPTPEEEQRALDQYRNSVVNASVFAARIKGLAAGSASAQAAVPGAIAVVTAAPSISEDALAKKIADLGPGKANAKVEAGRDGFKVDGVPFLDPEGTVHTYAFDGQSGDITYAIRSGDGWVYKFMKAGMTADPVTIATGRMNSSSGWQVLTVTGKQLAGDTVAPVSRGLMVGRAGAAFRYEPGQGSKGSAIPTVGPWLNFSVATLAVHGTF